MEDHKPFLAKYTEGFSLFASRNPYSKKKFVFSKTLAKVDNNLMIINNNIAEEVKKLKEEQGKDIYFKD